MRAAVLLVLVVACGCGKKPAGESTGTRPENAGAPAADGLIEVTAHQLWLDYRDDPARADAKYLDRTLRVTGRILAFEPGPGSRAVGLETGPPANDGRVLRPAVVVECGAAGHLAVSRLNESDEVVVIGRCEGHISAPGRVGAIKVTLADARIASHKK